ncbi:daunorubicin/doxorubicin resistance ABC transporter ATP-binding protein DrrA [Millisia brevis]|uniref:daunorubicin/doxorubicin resistance ABC transporter ATP-binding protein DrrA n=1 Tax=Millisia brevis TaxID=264148 RepID=UPI0008324C7C|nr:daunorubicin/doxorubicin resistance ABC transporter ATP-binding protein DrrA [Millisia brevis]
MPTRYAVEAEGLVKRFGEVTALDGLGLTVPEGTIAGVLGPNGAGKTTTIDVLTTLLEPDAGHARVAGRDVVAEAAEVRAVIGLTGQFVALDDNLTARENLELFGRLLKLGRRRSAERADELLSRFDLTDAADRRSGTFSGGMRRRLDLAASLIGRPEVLFLDEPTTGLDPRSRAVLWDVVRELRSDGMTILLTTQYLDEADALADRIVVIDHGRVIADGTADDLKDQAGGSVCRIATGTDRIRARVLELLAGRPGLTADADGVAIAATGASTLIEVVRILDGANIPVEDVALRRPTLDDVFFRLTGNPREDQATAEEATR